MMLNELPKHLSPNKDIDHVVELVLGAKLSVRAPYRMDIPKHQELRKQLTELIDVGFIGPSKVPFGELILL